jgi:NAD(P)-dependent dehydrogenase (short-subunit alcohol dehydrogenase family)
MGKQKTDEAYAELMREYASSNEIADLQKLISLKGKRAIVAGGAGMGLGAAVSRRLASQGAEVAILDVDGVRAAEVATELTAAYGARALAVEGDLTTVAGVEAATGDVFAQFGTVDILVNSLGGGAVGDFLEQSFDDYHRILALNLLSPMYLIRRVATT